MNSSFAHLRLLDWPFQTVPDERFYRVWAGRPEAKKTLERLLSRWQRYDRTTFLLILADFGPGKKHLKRTYSRRSAPTFSPTQGSTRLRRRLL